MSEEDDRHDLPDDNIGVHICLAIALSAVLASLLLFLFPVGPSPNFTLQDVKLYVFNLSATASTLTSALQITISCLNGYNNDSPRSFKLDKFYVYAAYRNQQITLPAMILPTHIGHPEAIMWSSHLNGTEVSLNPDLATSLEKDLLNGEMFISVKATGWMRSIDVFPARSRLKVDCLAYVAFKDKINDTNVIGNLVVKRPSKDRDCRVRVKSNGYIP